jgi:chromosome partitioning protein
MGLKPSGEYFTCYDVLLRDKPFSHAIAKTKELDVSISSHGLQRAEIELASRLDEILRLRKAMQKLKKLPFYDLILIDCPSSLGQLTGNALVAAHYVLVPTQANQLACHGVQSLMQTVKLIKTDFNPELTILGIFRAILDTSQEQHNQAAGEKLLNTHTLMNTITQYNSHPMADGSRKIPINYDPESTFARGYTSLAQEIIEGM